MALFRKNRTRGLWGYNLRILLGNSYWLIVAPIAIAQLVFMWNLATVGLSSADRAVQTIEVLAPILGALLCAYAVAPEHAGVGELVFVRPISLEKLLLLRLAAIFAFVLVLLVPPLVVYGLLVQDFPIGLALLSSLVSALFLSALAMAIASATRQPLAGLGVAAAFWVFDLLLGTSFNPVFTLHGYADYLAAAQMSDLWLYGKLLLLLFGALLYVWNRRQLGRPAAPRRTAAAVRTVVVVFVLLAGYAYGGAACKVAYGIRHEAVLGNQTWLWYRRAFQVYGPLPVPWLFGRAFPHYLLAKPGRGVPLAPNASDLAQYGPSMEAALREYPHSIWADNIAYEIALGRRLQRAPQPWTLLVAAPGGEPRREVVTQDEAGCAEALGRFVGTYPRSAFAPAALLRQGDIGVHLLDFGLALSAYQRLLRDYPRAPETGAAGVALHALYTRQGKTKEALQAARLAADAAVWDRQPMACLLAARSAQALGDTAVAKVYYQRALSAAETARGRAGARVHSGDTTLTPSRIIHDAESVMTEASRALRGSLRPQPAAVSAPTARISGEVLWNGRGLAGARVAVAEATVDQPSPTPFAAPAAGEAATDPHGAFAVDGLRPGSYRVLALAFPGDHQYARVTGLTLPFVVGSSITALPPISVSPGAAPPPHPRPQVRPTSPSRGGQTRSGPASSRGGRSSGGGRSRGRGGR